MIIDDLGIIRKLDEKSVIEYCKHLDKPLILYGIGENGEFTYNILKQNNIEVSAIADGSLSKQGIIIDNLVVISWQQALEKYPDAIIWICIVNSKIRNQVINEIRSAGYNSIFMIFNLKYPMDKEYYRDWDGTLPNIIIGKGNALINTYKILKKHEYSILRIISTDTNEVNIYNENIEIFKKDMQFCTNSNYIICDETKWNEIINTLHECGVCECIYRQIVGRIGEFNPVKYKFENMIIRDTIMSIFTYINKFYNLMVDDISKQLFKQIVQDFVIISKKKCKDLDEKCIKFLLKYTYMYDNKCESVEQKSNLKNFKEKWHIYTLKHDFYEIISLFECLFDNYILFDNIKFRFSIENESLNLQVIG